MKQHRNHRNDILYKATIPGCGTVTVRERNFRGEPVRVLTVGSAVQSAIYTRKEKRDRLLFAYMRGFDWIGRLLPEARSALLIGGGGFVYPRHLCRQHPDMRVDVSELVPEMVDIACRYFFLDEEKFPHLHIYCRGGLSHLRNSGTVYDIIINDAFTGSHGSREFISPDGILEICAHLSPDGIYCINLATALAGPFFLRTAKMLRVLRTRFQHTMLLPMHEGRPAWEVQNCLLFASRKEFRWFRLDLDTHW